MTRSPNHPFSWPAPAARASLVLALVCGSVFGGARPASAGELETIFFENKFEAIERQATDRLRRVPDDPQALAWRAESLMKQGAFADARTDIARLPAGLREGALARGDFAWYTGDWQGALVAYTEARRLAPDDAHAMWGVASALLHLEKLDDTLREADALLIRANQESPSFKAWALVLRGAVVGLKADRGSIVDKLASVSTVKTAFEDALKVDLANANASRMSVPSIEIVPASRS